MRPRLLLFTRTTDYRHDSIPAGVAMLEAIGGEDGFDIDAHEDPSAFDQANLKRYDLVIWLSTSGTILTEPQRDAFERWLKAGGAFAGIHSATASEYDWPAFEAIIGSRFDNHPEPQRATILVEDRNHPSTGHLEPSWQWDDEWYSFRGNPRGRVRVLATVDEATYTGGEMGSDHPIAWCGRYGDGHTWYTALGHPIEAYRDPVFVEHVRGGINSLVRCTPVDSPVDAVVE
jgi:type 1 glutamine amidotransferase